MENQKVNGGENSMNKNVVNIELIKQLKNQAVTSVQTLENIELMYNEIMNVKDEVRHIERNVCEMESNIMKVGKFVIDFHNEYRDHDALTTAQTKEMKEAQHYVTSKITKILVPTLPESRKRGSDYLVQWNKVNKAIWSIFKRNVNVVNIPYDRTPKIKFQQGLDYLKGLSISDYLAYRDERWSDIKKFEFNESLVEEKITLDKIVNTGNKELLKLNS